MNRMMTVTRRLGLPALALALCGLLGAGLAGCAHAPSASPLTPVPPAQDLARSGAQAAAASSVVAVDLPRADTAHEPPATDTPYGTRADALALADAIAQRNGLPSAWVRAALAQATYQASAARLMMPAPQGMLKNWSVYRSRFVEPGHIQAGAAFWRDNAAWLQRAQAVYGVPPSVIVGLLGVETYYGRIMGHYRLLDVLATLSLDFPAGRSDRSDFFRKELEQFLVLAHDSGADPAGYTGSYAGAVGLPQFMPSSWRQYAVDFDGDGKIDLIHDPADAIGSVAHYLSRFGWQRDLPTHFAVTPPDDAARLAELLAPDIVPSFSAQDMSRLGARLPADAAASGALALVSLPNGLEPATFVAGTRNFYTITRYNHSAFYAMAVIELGNAVAQVAQASTQEASADTAGPADATRR
jgi:membrane-bound lytic murein transglycosylase B